jgi:hypothetical protein
MEASMKMAVFWVVDATSQKKIILKNCLYFSFNNFIMSHSPLAVTFVAAVTILLYP